MGLKSKPFTPAVILLLASVGSAEVVQVTGVTDEGANPKTYANLSAAATYLNGQGTGGHTINVMVNNITDNGEVVINVPMTINGDGNTDGFKCDVLVDLATIRADATQRGNVEKAYLEVQTVGAVTINDLKIHPSSDCPDAAPSVDGIWLYEPAVIGGTGNYTLNRVWVSGSDVNDNYVDLDTSNDLFTLATKKWSMLGPGGQGDDANAVIHIANNISAGTDGVLNAELNNCMAGLGTANGVNAKSRGGSIKINGGLYGHVSRDGININGTGVTLTGSPTNRLRLLRSTMVSGSDSHLVEVHNGANVSAIEYVDAAGFNTAQCFKVWSYGSGGNATVQTMQYVRVLGKLGTPGNNPVALLSAKGGINNMSNCTFFANSGGTSSHNPLQVNSDITRNINIKDSIFASNNAGAILSGANLTGNGIKLLQNSGLPTVGGITSEQLANPPVTGAAASNIVPAYSDPSANNVSACPVFIKTASQYNWSETEVDPTGTNLLAGNPDVLRPSHPSYANASSTGDLTGGAGGVVGTQVAGQPTVTAAAFTAANILEITFSETMGSGALLPATYTLANVAQRGTLAAQPDTVAWVSGTTYRLTWNSGARAGGQFHLTFDPTLADADGELINAPAGASVPVNVSGFSME